MLEDLKKILDNAIKLDELEAFEQAVDSEIKELIIQMNTREQLGELGVDSDSKDLGDYADFTIEERSKKGLQVGHIDFKVTGDYWRSWEVKVVGDVIEISVDKFRFDELVFDLRFSEKHVGLTDENLAELAGEMLERYRDYVIKKLFE